jgi:hypothetical protein
MKGLLVESQVLLFCCCGLRLLVPVLLSLLPPPTPLPGSWLLLHARAPCVRQHSSCGSLFVYVQLPSPLGAAICCWTPPAPEVLVPRV